MSSVYVTCPDCVLLIVVVYVDDMLLIGPNKKRIADVKADSHASFKMSDLGRLHHYLGIPSMKVDAGNSIVSNKIHQHYCSVLDLKTINLLSFLWKQVSVESS